MPLTLAQAKATMTDKVDQLVIDEFRRESSLLDRLTFDDAVSPGTGGSTLTYGYVRLLTPSTASTRKINSEYTPNEAVRKKCTADIKIFGGAFTVDRVIQETSGNLNEIEFQLKDKIKAARNYFHYLVINGDSVKNTDEFDGLDAILTGSSTEYKDSVGLDISNSAMLDTNYKKFLDVLDEFLSGLDGKPDALLGGSKIISRIQAVARRAGYLTQSEDSFGRKANGYNGIEFIDLGKYFDGTSSSDVVNPYSVSKTTGEGESAVTTTTTGLCDLYAVKFGLDGFHAVSPAGGKLISTYLPDLKQPGAVKKGEVEMKAAVVLKNTLKAGVMRGIKVQ